MKAYEIFCQDVMGDELRRTGSDRRTYYNNLRQALRTELSAGAECELVEHFAKRLEEGSAQYMYLLDAAALWECYEATVDGLRFPRDIGSGMPFPVANGSRMSWPEVQRQSDMHILPVAVLDDELLARIRALVIYAQTPLAERDCMPLPVVNPRARLTTADARTAGAIPAPGKPASVQDEAVQEQVAAYQQRIAQLEAERDALQTEVTRLEKRPQQENEEMVQLADLILHNRMAEAAALARRLGGTLDESLQHMQELQQNVAQLQEQLRQAQEQMQADSAQAEALRAQQQAAAQRVQEIRVECEQVQADAVAAQQARKVAERSLSDARAELSQENARLREAQGQLARTTDAVTLTRMQADRLS